MDDLRRLQNRGASRRASGSIGPGGNLGPSSLSDRNGSRRCNLGSPLTRTNTPLVDKKDEEANTDIAHGPPYVSNSHSLKADSAPFVSKADSAAMLAHTKPVTVQTYLRKKALRAEVMEDDAPPNGKLHQSEVAGNGNIGMNSPFGSASAPGTSTTEQQPASMSEVLAYLSNIQQGIASIDKGMIGIQREIASVKEQVNALPGIFAVLPEFVGREVVSHVQDELLEPLGQRMSDLEQKFNGLQKAEEKVLAEEVSLPQKPAEAPAAACDTNCLEDKGLTEKASYTPIEAPMLATGYDDTELAGLEESFDDGVDAYDYNGARWWPYREDQFVRPGSWRSQTPVDRYHQHIEAAKWGAEHGKDEWTRRRAKSVLDREQAELNSLQQPLEPEVPRW
ncbi:hypothetical protein LTR56_009556 [Elasticomyces elasticus]|nr:hypothetical protein LTR56_009556 [Elasticomyces elasticus]KAK3657236.1 hypothetical protein LTR22_009410 [Elasticomyces elasticus]KAK4922217.1 hypothetical protein LTR49_010438 [Elasticomyces elasticus]KAK5760844.1 hypothetical protein LTS12_009020 [Elasticomyces elasticus]